jgi:hypothetical protein
MSCIVAGDPETARIEGVSLSRVNGRARMAAAQSAPLVFASLGRAGAA